jgi:hypothetical protein
MDLIAKNEKYYKLFAKLPGILFAILAVLGFVWGIIDAVEFDVFYVDDGFLAWFLWQLIVDGFGAIVYFITKISIAPIILQTEFLRKISNK